MNIGQNSKKFPASCPNIIKFYSNGMDDVDIIDKKKQLLTDLLEKQTLLLLEHVFDIIDVAHVNSVILST